jgi:hypothetical protein
LAAKGCVTLLPPPANLFTRAAALAAKRAARAGASTAVVEAILARGLAQERALAAGGRS